VAEDWTIERELMSLAGEQSAAPALKALKLIPSHSDRYSIGARVDWHRAGAETYQFQFHIDASPDFSAEYLLKACVAFSPARTLEDLLDAWLARRDLLARAGVSVPRLFAAGRGVILEEFIPYSLADVFEVPRDIDSRLWQGLAAYGGVLAALGFRPIEAFADLRSRGDDVVAIDFGEDLGPPHLGSEPAAILARLEAFTESFQNRPTPPDQAAIRGTFHATYKQITEQFADGQFRAHH